MERITRTLCCADENILPEHPLMNILHFTHTFVPIYGGTTTRLLNLFQNDGNNHTLVVPHLGSQYVPRTMEHLNSDDTYDNMCVKRSQLSIFKKSRLPLLEYASTIFNWHRNAGELLKRVGRDRYDLVYGHNPMEFALAARRYAASSRTPLVFEVHGLMKDTLPASVHPLKRIYHTWGNALTSQVEQDVLRHAKVIVVQTGRMKDRIMHECRVPESSIRVIYNGVDADTFCPESYRDRTREFRSARKIEDKVTISYFGFLDDNNGIDFFLRGLDGLTPALKHRIRVMVVGRGPYSRLVEDYSSSNDFFEYAGLVDYEDIPLYYAGSDVFVIPRPSNLATETLVPMKLLEAMAMEKIVLVSNVGGMTEVVEDNHTGILFERENISDFQHRISEIIQRIDEYRPMGFSARQAVVGKYTWKQARSILATTFSDLVKKNTMDRMEA